MPKNIIKNNLIAIAIHACVCIAVLLPTGIVMGQAGPLWSDSVYSGSTVTQWLFIVGTTIIAIFLYFFAGRKFLANTGHLLTNALSVIAIPLLMLMVTVIGFYFPSLFILGLLFTPIVLISETISFFLRIELKYAYMIMSILPTLAVWLGLVAKR